MIGVSVFSVNSCWRPSTTTRKPTGYPRRTSSGAQAVSGSRAFKSPWATSENPIERPAAIPDQARAAVERSSSSSPSARTAS